MKELCKKKSVMIIMATIAVLVSGIIAGIAGKTMMHDRKVMAHINFAEKYLSELDYEQAIAEYMAALELEPENQEILDALEQLYLDTAQQYMDQLQYEKAIELLDVGYELLHRIIFQTKKHEAELLALQAKEMIEQEKREKEWEEWERELEKQKKAEEEKAKERIEENQRKSEEVFAESGDAELADYERQVSDFIFSLEEEVEEEFREYNFVCKVEVKENSEERCQILLVLDPGGKPLYCYEVEVSKKTGKMTVLDYYSCEIMDDGSLFVFENLADNSNVVGRSS